MLLCILNSNIFIIGLNFDFDKLIVAGRPYSAMCTNMKGFIKKNGISSLI